MAQGRVVPGPLARAGWDREDDECTIDHNLEPISNILFHYFTKALARVTAPADLTGLT